MALDEEIRYFEAHREELLEHYRGQFAVVKGECLLGTFTTFAEAFNSGVAELGNEPFLVKEVTEEDELAAFPALSVGIVSARP